MISLPEKLMVFENQLIVFFYCCAKIQKVSITHDFFKINAKKRAGITPTLIIAILAVYYSPIVFQIMDMTDTIIAFAILIT